MNDSFDIISLTITFGIPAFRYTHLSCFTFIRHAVLRCQPGHKAKDPSLCPILARWTSGHQTRVSHDSRRRDSISFQRILRGDEPYARWGRQFVEEYLVTQFNSYDDAPNWWPASRLGASKPIF